MGASAPGPRFRRPSPAKVYRFRCLVLRIMDLGKGEHPWHVPSLFINFLVCNSQSFPFMFVRVPDGLCPHFSMLSKSLRTRKSLHRAFIVQQHHQTQGQCTASDTQFHNNIIVLLLSDHCLKPTAIDEGLLKKHYFIILFQNLFEACGRFFLSV